MDSTQRQKRLEQTNTNIRQLIGQTHRRVVPVREIKPVPRTMPRAGNSRSVPLLQPLIQRQKIVPKAGHTICLKKSESVLQLKSNVEAERPCAVLPKLFKPPTGDTEEQLARIRHLSDLVKKSAERQASMKDMAFEDFLLWMATGRNFKAAQGENRL